MTQQQRGRAAVGTALGTRAGYRQRGKKVPHQIQAGLKALEHVERRYRGAGLREAAAIKIGKVFPADGNIPEQDIQMPVYARPAVQQIKCLLGLKRVFDCAGGAAEQARAGGRDEFPE